MFISPSLSGGTGNDLQINEGPEVLGTNPTPASDQKNNNYRQPVRLNLGSDHPDQESNGSVIRKAMARGFQKMSDSQKRAILNQGLMTSLSVPHKPVLYGAKVEALDLGSSVTKLFDNMAPVVRETVSTPTFYRPNTENLKGLAPSSSFDFRITLKDQLDYDYQIKISLPGYKNKYADEVPQGLNSNKNKQAIIYASQFGTLFPIYSNFVFKINSLLYQRLLNSEMFAKVKNLNTAIKKVLLSGLYHLKSNKAYYVYSARIHSDMVSAIDNFTNELADKGQDSDKQIERLLENLKELKEALSSKGDQYIYDEITDKMDRDRSEFLFKYGAQFYGNPIISFFKLADFEFYYLRLLKRMIDFSLRKPDSPFLHLFITIQERLAKLAGNSEITELELENDKKFAYKVAQADYNYLIDTLDKLVRDIQNLEGKIEDVFYIKSVILPTAMEVKVRLSSSYVSDGSYILIPEQFQGTAMSMLASKIQYADVSINPGPIKYSREANPVMQRLVRLLTADSQVVQEKFIHSPLSEALSVSYHEMIDYVTNKWPVNSDAVTWMTEFNSAVKELADDLDVFESESGARIAHSSEKIDALVSTLNSFNFVKDLPEISEAKPKLLNDVKQIQDNKFVSDNRELAELKNSGDYRII